MEWMAGMAWHMWHHGKEWKGRGASEHLYKINAWNGYGYGIDCYYYCGG